MRIILLAMLLPILVTSCKKNTDENSDFLNRYKNTGLSNATVQELRDARNATARYRSLDSALADGYVDISVDVQLMGHHYMRTEIVDSIFDKTKPEILVYNRNHETHEAYLVAVEYAVPLIYPRPAGFTGNADVWKDDSGFPFWLLHAWVWAYNPDGAFNWTNQLIHLH